MRATSRGVWGGGVPDRREETIRRTRQLKFTRKILRVELHRERKMIPNGSTARMKGTSERLGIMKVNYLRFVLLLKKVMTKIEGIYYIESYST